MLSPAHAPEADGTTSDPGTPGGPRRIGPAHWALLLGLLTVLCAVAFPLAPVTQLQATYAWDAADGPAAIPLMPYQPTSAQVTVGCEAVRSAAPGTTLLRTVPARTDPGAEPLAGLELTAGPGLTVRSAGADVGTVDVPAGDCTVTVTSDVSTTRVLVDGRPVLTAAGDLRPAVAGAFADVDVGQSFGLVADTRWETTISPLKAAIGVVCLAALLGTLVALGRCDRAARPRVRLVAEPGRPRVVDAAVTVVLLGWWWIGPVTVDDGYIAGIVRARGADGFIGNGYRWLNAPEAPFSWFYELYAPWSDVSASTLWMRLPSTLLGLGCWLLLSRAVLPRLGVAFRLRGVPWIAAAAFASWWLPFDLGMRPEPWVAVGTLAVLVAVERAVARRAVLPLAVALLLAGVTTAVTPGGLIAFAPIVAAVLPLVRLLRARRDLHVLPLVAGLLGAAAAPVLLMFSDQSLAAVLESVRVRREIGGGVPWSQEYERYALLLNADDFQGALGKRAPVLLTLVAVAGAVWSVAGRDRAGLAAGPVRRLVVAFVLSVVCLTATPTKWTQQFGVLAGLGAAVLTVAVVGWTTSALRVRTRGRSLLPVLAGTAALTAAGSLVLAGRDLWPYVSGWYPTEWGLHPPGLAGRALSSLWLVLGVLAIVVVGGIAVWRAASPRPAGSRSGWPSRCCSCRSRASPGPPPNTPAPTPWRATPPPRSPATRAGCSRTCSSRPTPAPASCPRSGRSPRPPPPPPPTSVGGSCPASPSPAAASPPGSPSTRPSAPATSPSSPPSAASPATRRSSPSSPQAPASPRSPARTSPPTPPAPPTSASSPRRAPRSCGSSSSPATGPGAPRSPRSPASPA